MKKTLQQFAVEYGMVGVVVYLTIFTLVMVGAWAAIRAGWSPEGAMANAGAWTAAYIATKITQPLRIIATVAVTPFVARFYEKLTKKGSVQS